jgi:hypothetical protein
VKQPGTNLMVQDDGKVLLSDWGFAASANIPTPFSEGHDGLQTPPRPGYSYTYPSLSCSNPTNGGTLHFTTDNFLAVHAMLGFNFVLNDMTAWIVDYENKVNFFATPVHDYNVVHLIANIPPGTYGLVVTTGLTQYTTTDTTWFPPCLEYTMSFSVKALPDKPRCWDVPSVPASLSTPQYLGNIDRVHLVGN